jgi:histidinol-phosphatase (PHP family)
VRALAKGADEPYVARSILLEARELGISVVPGDDSHSVDSVGQNLEAGIRILRDLGFDTRWRTPSPGTPR